MNRIKELLHLVIIISTETGRNYTKDYVEAYTSTENVIIHMFAVFSLLLKGFKLLLAGLPVFLPTSKLIVLPIFLDFAFHLSSPMSVT